VRLKAVRGEDGFTLVEMLVTMMIMLVVLFALYSIFDMSLRVFSFGNNKVEAVEQARTGLERMEREIRMAYPVNKSSDQNQIFITSTTDTTVTPTLNTSSMVFGNDTDKPLTIPYVVDAPNEVIRYGLFKNSSAEPCDPGGVCKVYRSVGSGGYQRLVEFVRAPVPASTTPPAPAYAGGLRFTYLKENGVQTSVEAEVEIVRIELDVSVDEGSRDEGTQTLVTEVALRNRGE
jgi:prepilin-type N-terminal cleavage/methylation domain-containing protein